MSFRAFIDEMKAVAAGKSSVPKRADKRVFASKKAVTQFMERKGPTVQRTLKVDSLAAVTRLFTPENRRMVAYLAKHKVNSMAELAKQMHRAESNLSRTVKKFEELGLISLKPGEGRTRVPYLTVKSLRLTLDVTNGKVTLFDSSGDERPEVPAPIIEAEKQRAERKARTKGR